MVVDIVVSVGNGGMVDTQESTQVSRLYRSDCDRLS